MRFAQSNSLDPFWLHLVVALLMGWILIDSHPTNAATIANSQTDFSGTQGSNNWTYGYYSSPFTPATFQEMPHFDGTEWDIQQSSGGYWTLLTSIGGHPNGINGNQGRLPIEQWADRRWTSNVSGNIDISGTVASLGGGSMVARIILNGNEIFSQSAGSLSSYDVTATVAVGSILDFAISPPANGIDVNGYTQFAAVINGAPEPSTIVLAAFGCAGLAFWVRRKRFRTAHFSFLDKPE
jgi:hypothetical protein